MEQIDFDKLAAEEQKKNEKAYKKMKWRNRIRGFFGVKVKEGHSDDVEIPPQIGVVEDEEI